MNRFREELENIYALCGYAEKLDEARRYGEIIQSTLLAGKRERKVFQGTIDDQSRSPLLPTILSPIVRRLDTRHDQSLKEFQGEALMRPSKNA